MMRLEVAKNMGTGTISSNKKRVVIGNSLPDPFMDSYKQEGLACADILELMDLSENYFVSIRFNRAFLKKLVHSHLLYIREMERNLNERVYAH